MSRAHSTGSSRVASSLWVSGTNGQAPVAAVADSSSHSFAAVSAPSATPTFLVALPASSDDADGRCTPPLAAPSRGATADATVSSGLPSTEHEILQAPHAELLGQTLALALLSAPVGEDASSSNSSSDADSDGRGGLGSRAARTPVRACADAVTGPSSSLWGSPACRSPRRSPVGTDGRGWPTAGGGPGADAASVDAAGGQGEKEEDRAFARLAAWVREDGAGCVPSDAVWPYGVAADASEGGELGESYLLETGTGEVAQLLPGMEELHQQLLTVKRSIDALSLRVRQLRVRGVHHRQLPSAGSHMPAVESVREEIRREQVSASSTAVVPREMGRDSEGPDGVGVFVEDDDSGTGASAVDAQQHSPHTSTQSSFIDAESVRSRVATGSGARGRAGPSTDKVSILSLLSSTPDGLIDSRHRVELPTNERSRLAPQRHRTAGNGAPSRTAARHSTHDSPPSSPSSSPSASSSFSDVGDGQSNEWLAAGGRSNGHAPAHAAPSPLTPGELLQLKDEVVKLRELYAARAPLLRQLESILCRHATVSERWEGNEARRGCYRCQRSFSTLTRRHHCRRCGRLCCAACSSFFGRKQDTSVPELHARTAARGRHPTVKTEYAARMTVNDALDSDLESHHDVYTYPALALDTTPPMKKSGADRSDSGEHRPPQQQPGADEMACGLADSASSSGMDLWSLSAAANAQDAARRRRVQDWVRLCGDCYYSCLRARQRDVPRRLRGANRYILDDGYYYFFVLTAEEMQQLSTSMSKPETLRKRLELLSSVWLERSSDVVAAAPQAGRHALSSAAQNAPRVLRTLGNISAFAVQRARHAAEGYLDECRRPSPTPLAASQTVASSSSWAGAEEEAPPAATDESGSAPPESLGDKQDSVAVGEKGAQAEDRPRPMQQP